MERGATHTSLNGPALPGQLARLGLGEVASARPSFVDGMGRWFDWTDAIRLAAALNVTAAEGPSSGPGKRLDAATVAASFERQLRQLRETLGSAIEDDPAAAGDGWSSTPSRVAPGSPRHDDSEFAPLRRRYVELQQAMDAAIAPLRLQAREALAKFSPAHQRLAAIDAVMADVLRTREQAVLATLPARLQRHFERRMREQAMAATVAPAVTAVKQSPQAAAWRAAFDDDMRQVLRAELDLRLQPLQGLLEALRGASVSTATTTAPATAAAPR